MTDHVGALERGEGSVKPINSENLLHCVAFCCIFLVIVKFKDLPDHVAQGKTGNRMNMRLRGFSLSYMCHFVPFCAVSLLQRVRAVGSRIWIVWYMRSCLSNRERLFLMSEGCRGLFSEESFMQAEPANRGMRMYGERRRATTRVAPMTGLSEVYFRTNR